MKETIFPEIVKQMKKRKEGTQDIADLIGQKYKSQITRRLQGKLDWTIREAKILCNHYNIKFEKLFREEMKK